MQEKNTEYVLTFNAFRDNLKTQMAIKEISIKQIAKVINVNRDTAGNKLSRKSPITLKEAFLIKNHFFPDLPVTYLFEELDTKQITTTQKPA